MVARRPLQMVWKGGDARWRCPGELFWGDTNKMTDTSSAILRLLLQKNATRGLSLSVTPLRSSCHAHLHVHHTLLMQPLGRQPSHLPARASAASSAPTTSPATRVCTSLGRHSKGRWQRRTPHAATAGRPPRGCPPPTGGGGSGKGATAGAPPSVAARSDRASGVHHTGRHLRPRPPGGYSSRVDHPRRLRRPSCRVAAAGG